MARRSRKSNPAWIIVAVALILAAIVGAQFFISTGSEPYRTTEVLDVDAYLENSNSLRGNVYRVEGEIVNSLAWSPTEGRLFSISVINADGVLPILVTNNFNHINVQRGQRFVFMVEVDDKGLLKTRDLTKA